MANKKKEEIYRQCELAKGTTHEIAWIPKCYAHKSKTLVIHGDPGWSVVSVGHFDSTLGILLSREKVARHYTEIVDI